MNGDDWCLLVIGMVAILGAYAMFVRLKYDMGWDWRSRIVARIEGKLISRHPMEPDVAVKELAELAGVPIEFAERYLLALSESYMVPVGYVYPKDRFGHELSVHRAELPRSLARKVKGGMSDGDNVGEFVCWEWYSENAHLPIRRLEEIALRPDLTVASLCRDLYNLDIERQKTR